MLHLTESILTEAPKTWEPNYFQHGYDKQNTLTISQQNILTGKGFLAIKCESQLFWPSTN